MNPTIQARPTASSAAPADLPPPIPLARQHRERRLQSIKWLMFVSDLVLVGGAFLLAWPLHAGTVPAGLAGPLVSALVGATVWAACFYAAGAYDPNLLGRRSDLTARMLRASVVAVIAQILLLFAAKPGVPELSRIGVAAFWLVAAGGTLVVRWTAWRSLTVRLLEGRASGAAIVVGADPQSQERCDRILRWMLFPPRVEAVVDGSGVADLISRMAQQGTVDQVLVARNDLPRDTLIELVQRCVGWGLKVTVVSPAFNVMIGRAPVVLLDGMPILEIQPSGLFTPARSVKRAIDILGAAAGGLVLLPLLAVIAALVKLSSPGPVLYRQKRVGRGGRIFHFYKFRSMVVNNDEEPHRAYLRNLVQNGTAASVGSDGHKVYKLVDDPRVTRFGAFLRRTSIDELPQLWNILKGEMSLVGPRPCLPYEWELYKEWQKRRLDVTPGLTGLWQVTGRSRVSFDDMVLLDLYYIAHWSIGLDMELILKTIPVVLSGRGGH